MAQDSRGCAEAPAHSLYVHLEFWWLKLERDGNAASLRFGVAKSRVMEGVRCNNFGEAARFGSRANCEWLVWCGETTRL